MDRDIVYQAEQGRGWDFVTAEFYAMVGLGNLMAALAGSTLTVVSGLTATGTGTNLVVTLAAGNIYQSAEADASSAGWIAADSDMITQQGISAAQSITLSTAGITGGQSRYTLIQAQFAQVDLIPSNDPTGGNLPFYNPSNPASPTFATEPTARTAQVVIGTKNGTPAATGSEVPPTPDAGWVPLYLIDLAFGQTTLSTGQIIVAGPSASLNVPSNYPAAPFLAGLLSSHHGGVPGQAPKINLATETQGQLPPGSIAQAFGTLAGVRSVSANTTFTSADYGYLLKYDLTATGPGVFTLPMPTVAGSAYWIMNNSSFTLQLNSPSGPWFQGFTDTGAYNQNAIASVVMQPGNVIFVSVGNGFWEVLYNSQFFGLAGCLAGQNVETTSTAFGADQVGTILHLTSAATSNVTFTIPLPSAVPAGSTFYIDNNNATHTIGVTAGGSSVFVGQTSTGNGTSNINFTVPSLGKAILISRNGFWCVLWNSNVVDGYINAVQVSGGLGVPIAFVRASAFTPGTTYAGSTFTGLGFSGTWICTANCADGSNNLGTFVRIS